MDIVLFVISFIIVVFMASHIGKFVSDLLNRKISKKALVRRILQGIVCSTTTVILMPILITTLEKIRMDEQAILNNRLENYTAGYFSEELLSVLETVYFDPEIINKEEIIWDHFILNEIGLSNYIVWEEETESFDELRGMYLDNIINSPTVPSADLTEICSNINAFYGTSFIPYTTRSLAEVTGEIRKKKEKDEVVSPELYAEELYLRSLICNKSSAEALHQLGRSADDTLKQTVNEEDNIQSIFEINNKTLIFFGSITIASYQLELAQYEKKPGLYVTKKDIALVYYRMAEIYIYLDKHCYFTGNYSFYHQHFKLSAEACLARAQSEYDPTNTGLDMNKEFPYFDDYYAELLSYFIIQYDAHEDGISDEFYNHANKYVNSPYARINNVTNSQDLITRMDVFLKKREQKNE